MNNPFRKNWNQLLVQAIVADDLGKLDRALKSGARLDVQDAVGDRPIHTAVRHNRSTTMIERLVNAGADVLAPGRGGETAVEAALRQENFGLTHLLTGLAAATAAGAILR